MITIHGVSADSHYFEKDELMKANDKGGRSEYYSQELQAGYWAYNADILKERTGVDINQLGVKNMFEKLAAQGVGSKEMVGQDLTFSANKDISLLWALGDDRLKEIAYQAHRQAVERVLKHIDENLIKTRETHDNETFHVQGKGMTAVAFDHGTSREKDPQLHTHVVILNQIERETDGEIRAIDFKATLKGAERKQLDILYKSEMARYLVEYGIRIEWDKDGKDFKVVGIEDKQRQAFSKREQEILKYAEEKNLDMSNQHDRQKAILETREAKGKVSFEELKQEWHERSNRLGLDINKLIEENKLSKEEIEKKIQELELKAESDVARQVQGEMNGVFTKTEFLAQAAQIAHQLNREFDLEQSEKELQKLMEKGEVLSLGKVSGQEMFVTKEFIEAEKYIANSVNKTLEDGKGFVSEQQFEKDMQEFREVFKEKNGFWLSNEQEQALKMIFTSNKAINGIQGYAGVGKSALFKAAAEYGEWLGKKYGADKAVHFIGMAPTGQAAKVLQESSGIKSATIHSSLNTLEKRGSLFELENQAKQNQENQEKEEKEDKKQNLQMKKEWDFSNVQKFEGRAVIVMDEAGMADSRLLSQVVKASEALGSKLVLSGDVNQFQSVGAGKAFEMMQRKGMETAHITGIRRQRDEQVREALKEFANGDPSKLQSLLEERKWIHEHKEWESIIAGVKGKYDDFLKSVNNDPSKLMVLAQTNKMVDALNEEIRSYLKEKGLVDKNGVFIEVVKDRSNTYIGKDIKDGQVVDEKEVKVGEKKEDTKEFARGDRIVFLKNDKRLDVQNGLQGTIEEINSAENTITVKTDNGKTVTFNYEQYNQFDYAYALTEHKSQGATVEHAIVVHEVGATKNAVYVAMTRAKGETHVYTTSKEEFKKDMTIKQENRSALELLEIQEREQKVLNAAHKELKEIENELNNNDKLTQKEKEQVRKAWIQAWKETNKKMAGSLTKDEFDKRWNKDPRVVKDKNRAFHNYYHKALPNGRVKSVINDKDFYKNERAFALAGGRYETQNLQNTMILNGMFQEWENFKLRAAIYQRTLNLCREKDKIINTGITKETLRVIGFEELKKLYKEITSEKYDGKLNGKEVIAGVKLNEELKQKLYDKEQSLDENKQHSRDERFESKIEKLEEAQRELRDEKVHNVLKKHDRKIEKAPKEIEMSR